MWLLTNISVVLRIVRNRKASQPVSRRGQQPHTFLIVIKIQQADHRFVGAEFLGLEGSMGSSIGSSLWIIAMGLKVAQTLSQAGKIGHLAGEIGLAGEKGLAGEIGPRA